MGFLDKKRKIDRTPTKLNDDAGAILDAFRQRTTKEKLRQSDTTDTEYWVAVCFRSRDEKDAFVNEFGLSGCPLIKGTTGDKYIDGPALARKLRDSAKK